ncbi:unnamed protein product, partial [Auanema sp. JU1783]
MITAPGDTYRERAELIAKNLTFTPGVVSNSLSVPTPNEILKAFLHAKLPNAKVASVNAFLLDEARELAQDLLSLKTERFNADLAQADDALFKKSNSIPDITPFESLTRNDGSNYGMVYKPEPSFIAPDERSRRLLIKIFLPLLNDRISQPSHSLKVQQSMLIVPTIAPTKPITTVAPISSTTKPITVKTTNTPITSTTPQATTTIKTTTTPKPHLITMPRESPVDVTQTSFPTTKTPPKPSLEILVERRSVSKEEEEQQQLLAKAKYAANKFDAETTFHTNITRRIAQDHLQYAVEIFQEDMKKNFMTSYETICAIQNKYLELWRSILHIEPTIAMRTILGRDDIAARFVGEHIVHIHACTEVKPAVIYYNHTVNGTCYLET